MVVVVLVVVTACDHAIVCASAAFSFMVSTLYSQFVVLGSWLKFFLMRSRDSQQVDLRSTMQQDNPADFTTFLFAFEEKIIEKFVAISDRLDCM